MSEILNKNTTALLIFSYSAEKEAERKPLFGNKKKELASDFFKILIGDTVELASKCGVEVFHFDEKKQQGTDFSSRYTNAFSDIFKLGFKNVISIGNDSPGLTVQHLKTALLQIEKHDAVIGPAKDGGVYLLGMSQSFFDSERFSQLPWQKNELLTSIIADFEKQHSNYFTLDLLVDIDSAKDMLEYATENPHSFLSYYILNNLFQNNSQFQFYLLKNYKTKAHIFLPLRAPPFYALAA